MAKNLWMPLSSIRSFTKSEVLERLQVVDNNTDARARVLQIETSISAKLLTLESSLANREVFKKLGTSPLVLLAHAKMAELTHVAQLEGDLLMAKRFSSIETSIGRMVEEVTLPVYGWKTVPSGMHSLYSVVDGESIEGDIARFVTLKSGYNTLNDDSGHSIAQEVIRHYKAWASDKKVSTVMFTFGTLYGTPNLSNKKDWHILRNVYNALSQTANITVINSPENAWTSKYTDQDISLTVDVKHGSDYWEYLGEKINADAFIEFTVAFIRASVRISNDSVGFNTNIQLKDLATIADVSSVPANYNIGILQRSQLPWLFMFVSYYCDKLI